MYTMGSNLKAVEQQIGMAHMNATMVDSLKGVNKVMSGVNANMNPGDMSKIMREFAKETEKMNMQGEMMNDAMDAMGDGEQESQADEVYSQILNEIGMAESAGMATGSGAIASPEAASAQPIAVSRKV